jgi:hypothetical protein
MKAMISAAALGLVGLMLKNAQANSIALYDGTQTGQPPSQGWLYYRSLLTTSTTTLAAGNVGPVTLNTGVTSGNSDSAGYSNYIPTSLTTANLANSSFPVLSPATGFDLQFTMKLDSESHSGSTDRAGFSVILIGNDLNGVELGFWNGQIWAQSGPSFTHTVEQETTLDPASGFHQYDLHIQGSNYTLYADGSSILTGPTRNYSSSGLLAYELPNYLFLGDDTNAAQSVSEIESVSVVVPEPAMMCMVLPALALLRRRRS